MTVTVPKLDSIADTYILTWETEKITIKLDRLSERSDGVTAEALITAHAGHLYHARLNLLSSHSKQMLVNALTKRVNTIDWQAIVEQACTKTLTEYRRGEPVVQVGNLPQRERVRYRLYPFILEGECTVLYGYGGTGKSKMAQFMALLTHCGIEALGMRPIKGNVLILDWETSQYTVDEWLKAVKVGIGIETEDLPFYRYCSRGLPSDIAEIQSVVLKNDIKLVIVDSVGMAIGGDAESQDMTRQYFGALRALKVASVSIDHKPKKGNTIYGSVYKTNIARSTFEVRSQQTPGEDYMDIGIYHRKANDTRLIQPIGFHVKFIGDEDNTEEAIITKQDVADIPDLEEGLSQRQQIMNLLKSGALSVKEIAETLGITEAHARVLLNRNKKAFIRNADGEWGLLTSYE